VRHAYAAPGCRTVGRRREYATARSRAEEGMSLVQLCVLGTYKMQTRREHRGSRERSRYARQDHNQTEAGIGRQAGKSTRKGIEKVAKNRMEGET